MTNQGDIATAGPDADGIFAQSVGGGGGTGGDAHLGLDNVGTLATLAGQNRSSFTKSLTIAVGGSGGASGNGNTVTVNNTGEITTAGAGSYGIFAQSVGGGGGEGGDGAIGALGKVGIGGAGGAAGDGGTVMVMQDGDITTSGDGATAIFAQSVGGGGGVAGNVDRGLATSMTEAGVTIPSVDIGIGLAFGQPGGSGGNGGDVTVSETGNIITTGIGADGIFAQSVGGGGGVAGNLGNTIGGTSLLGWTGSVGGTGNGGDVTVTENGNIYAYGDYSDGIYAQSAGGLGTGGAVNVTLDGSSAALGLDGVGIFAQSVGLAGNGDISVTIGSGGAAIGGTGPFSAGVILQDGAAHTIDNSGLIETLSGTDGTAISSLTGSTTINNNGAIVGSIYLGPGANVFNNNSGGSVYLGNYANNPLSTLTNTGPDALIEVVDGGTLDNQSATGTGFVNNGGTITVDAGGAVVTSTGDGVFRQNSGLTTVDGSWTQALTDLEGGQLAGSGTVNGTVFNNANPGAGPGQTGLNAGVFGVDPLTFTGLVTGTGNYGGDVVFDGEFSPGNSASAAANPNTTGAATPFSTDPNYYPLGTNSVASIFGGTLTFGATNTTFMDVSGPSADHITVDTANLGGTLTLVPTAPVAGSYTLLQASGSGAGIVGDFALAQMLNLGNDSDLYLTRSDDSTGYTATLRSTTADYGVPVERHLHPDRWAGIDAGRSRRQRQSAPDHDRLERDLRHRRQWL